MDHSKGQPNEPIAIIGTGCRFPGDANTSAKLWDLLNNPRDVQSTIPPNRFNADGFYDANSHHSASHTRHGYFLSKDHRHFDAEFFGIKPIEASSMDPQQRMLLEVVYESIEAAGLSMEAMRGSSTAVYVGLMAGDYGDMLNRDTSDFPPYVAAGTARSMMSNRVSYVFDWRGPSMTIDTACSSSLVAVHHAVQSLRLGESQVAVAAGANLILGPEQFIAGSNMKMMSPEGRSYMWDSRANGYARGEGIAAVVLKTLSAAIADGDDVECVIVETGLNQDGRTKGLTVPSAAAQKTLIESTYRKAGLDLTKPSDRPQYFEAHGTGTPAGDPVEAQAIHDAFFRVDTNDNTDFGQPLYCGSIKTVIGHTEGTAGMAGLMKASLALQHSVIPPNLFFENLATHVEPFYRNLEIVTEAKPWPDLAPGATRRASVNSFGFGGTNAHCILECYSPNITTEVERPYSYIPFVFSAASEKSLLSMLSAYSRNIERKPSIDLRALSRTLYSRRTVHSMRATFSASSVRELCDKLDLYVRDSEVRPKLSALVCASPLRILGVFTGQGAQWAGMGRKLMQLPAAAKIIEDLEESLAELPDRPCWSLKAELSADVSSSRVGEAAIAQPICTAAQILLVELLRAAGVHFSTVVGHSSGEIAAAFAANRLSAKDAIRIAYYRGVHLPLVGGINGEVGAMIAVGASYDEAQDICNSERFKGKLCVGASNSPASVTLSGDADAIQDVKVMFHEKKRFARLLRVDNAYHSHHMKRCSEAITASVRECNVMFLPPTSESTWVSSVDIKPMTDDVDILDYWHRNTIGCVFFSQALERALKLLHVDIAVEVGAHPALKGPALQVIESVLGRTIPYTGVLRRNDDDVNAFADGLGYLWASVKDAVVDLTAYDRFIGGLDLSEVCKNLPSYPWDHERAFWHESRSSHTFRHRPSQHELLGTKTSDYSADQIVWKKQIVPEEIPWIIGHRIQSQLVYPGSAYIVSAFEAAREAAAGQSVQLIELTNLVFGQPLVFESEDTQTEVLVALTRIKRHKTTWTANFTCHSVVNKDFGPMALNANCEVHITLDAGVSNLQDHPKEEFGMTKVDHERIYASFANCGYHYSGAFKALRSVARKIGAASGKIQVSDTVPTRLLIHPATLDAAMHSIAVAHSYPGDGRLTSLLLPIDISRIAINLSQAVESATEQSLRFNSFSGEDGGGDVDIYPASGSNAVLRLEGLRTKQLTTATQENDVHMFSETVWGPAFPMLNDARRDSNKADQDLLTVIEIATQISHRYPAMKILGIGTHVVDATKLFLTRMDGVFASYTHTDHSHNDLDQARAALESFDEKMIYKTLDMSVDLTNQDFFEHSFDLVVSLSRSSDIPDLDHTVKTIRRLLKPGGYFLCPRFDDISQLMPDVNTTSSHGNKQFPNSSVNGLTRAQTLRNYGFAENDWLLESESSDMSLRPVLLLQAIDERMRLLREPLGAAESPLLFSGITIVGGETSTTSSCINTLRSILSPYSSHVANVRTFADVVESDLSFGGNVVLLQDHDKPLFENFNNSTLKGLQNLFRRSRDVLWITHGYKCNLPHARMLVAFARCLVQEMSHIRLQILDLPSTKPLNATTISQSLLRLMYTSRWEDEGRLDGILWSVEPEIADFDGCQFIPRVKLSKSRNNSYNSSRRTVTSPVDSHTSSLTVAVEDEIYVLKAKTEVNVELSSTDLDVVSIRVTYSSLSAIRAEHYGYYYLVLGIDTATLEQVVALSTTISSVVEVPKGLVRPCSLPRSHAFGYLQTLLYSLISRTILAGLTRGECLLVLEPHQDFAAILKIFAAARGVTAVSVAAGTYENSNAAEETFEQMPSYASTRDIKRVLSKHKPSQVTCWAESKWAMKFCQALPEGIPVYTSRSYAAKQAPPVGTKQNFGASAVLDHVQAEVALIDPSTLSAGVVPLPLADLQGSRASSGEVTFVNWSTTASVPVQVQPADQRVRFRSDRTYWLVGLTGDLGLSLCEWMIARNATNIVLSSRDPNVDSRWLAHFASLGATVKVHSCDVTDYKSLQITHNKITTHLPPIVGVCHGAMVLRDSLIQDLNISQVHQVLKPKVDGAIHLDKLFQDHDLDFFVMLSSIAAITGNPGQAVYAAGNGFLGALTAQRRAHGKAASSVALGAIIGSGYATRGLTLAQQISLEKAGVMWTSEQDFHSAFAEAVLGSPPSSNGTGEFGTGIPITYTDDVYKPKHSKNPIFSHLLLKRTSDHENLSDYPTKSVRAQLLCATTLEDLSHILEAFLTSKLRKALQIVSAADVIDQTAESLGIDSLIAVEMKSWLMRELNVDVPVLVIIGGMTMRGVLAHCVKLLDPNMTPLLRLEVNGNTTVAPNTTKPMVGQLKKSELPLESALLQTATFDVKITELATYDKSHSPGFEDRCSDKLNPRLPSNNRGDRKVQKPSPMSPTGKMTIDAATTPSLQTTIASEALVFRTSDLAKAPVVSAIRRGGSTEGSSMQSQNGQVAAIEVARPTRDTKSSRISRLRTAFMKRFGLV